MGPLDFINHLLNFALPAAVVAALVAVSSHVALGRAAKGPGIFAAAGIGFLVGLGVLAGGLLLFGRDGKMATYAALVIACATTQWIVRRAWR